MVFDEFRKTVKENMEEEKEKQDDGKTFSGRVEEIREQRRGRQGRENDPVENTDEQLEQEINDVKERNQSGSDDDGIFNKVKEAAQEAGRRSDRTLALLGMFRDFEYEHQDEASHPQRYEYETHTVQDDLLRRQEDFLNFQAERGWQLVRTYSHEDLGVDQTGYNRMIMVFERPVDSDE
jgi:hypothetical protein